MEIQGVKIQHFTRQENPDQPVKVVFTGKNPQTQEEEVLVYEIEQASALLSWCHANATLLTNQQQQRGPQRTTILQEQQRRA